MPAGAEGAWTLSLLLLLGGICAHAGEESSLDLKQVPPSLEEPWKFTIGIPGWMAGFYGNIGINGITSPVSVGFNRILPHVDFASTLEAGVQKGKFGIMGSLIYASVSGDADRGGLLSKVDLRVDEYVSDFGLSYRIVDGPHGWIDALAGCRYTNLYERITLHPDNGALTTRAPSLWTPLAIKSRKI